MESDKFNSLAEPSHQKEVHRKFGKFRPLSANSDSRNQRNKDYYPSMTQIFREWVTLYENSIKESKIHNRLTRKPLQNPNEHTTGPQDATQNDLVPKLPPPGGYRNNVAAMELISRYFFAHPITKQDAKIVARFINNIKTKHAYMSMQSFLTRVQNLYPK